MSLYRHFLLPLSLVVVIFSSCGSKTSTEESTEKEGHSDEHENVNTVTLTAEQMKSIGLELGVIEQKNISSSVKANGILTVPNQNKANATSLYGGVVRTIHIQPGSYVKKGQTIATIANPEFVKLQEDYLNVANRISLAEIEYNRQRQLYEGNAGALKNVQQTENELRTLRATSASLRQQLGLIGISPASVSRGRFVTSIAVRSPIAGSVSKIAVNIGSYIDVTTPVAEIVNNSQLHLDLFVYEQDLKKIRVNQTIHFRLTNAPDIEYDAKIFSIGTSFETDSKTIPVHAIVMGNKVGLIEGMNVTAIISMGNVTVPAVPSDAIVNTQNQDYIFIVTDEHAETEHHEENKDTAGHTTKEPYDHEEKDKEVPKPGSMTFEKIPVRKGITDVGYTEITLLKEIPTNSKIVVKGAFFVLAKITNAGEEHGH